MHDVALGRGIFIWLLFRSLGHAIGWPATMAIVVAVVVGATFARQRQQQRRG